MHHRITARQLSESFCIGLFLCVLLILKPTGTMLCCWCSQIGLKDTREKVNKTREMEGETLHDLDRYFVLTDIIYTQRPLVKILKGKNIIM